jgi:hypothetical protein
MQALVASSTQNLALDLSILSVINFDLGTQIPLVSLLYDVGFATAQAVVGQCASIVQLGSALNQNGTDAATAALRSALLSCVEAETSRRASTDEIDEHLYCSSSSTVRSLNWCRRIADAPLWQLKPLHMC